MSRIHVFLEYIDELRTEVVGSLEAGWQHHQGPAFKLPTTVLSSGSIFSRKALSPRHCAAFVDIFIFTAYFSCSKVLQSALSKSGGQ